MHPCVCSQQGGDALWAAGRCTEKRLTARTYLDRKRASKLHVAPARVVGERELVDEHRAEAVAIPKHLRQPLNGAARHRLAEPIGCGGAARSSAVRAVSAALQSPNAGGQLRAPSIRARGADGWMARCGADAARSTWSRR